MLGIYSLRVLGKEDVFSNRAPMPSMCSIDAHESLQNQNVSTGVDQV